MTIYSSDDGEWYSFRASPCSTRQAILGATAGALDATPDRPWEGPKSAPGTNGLTVAIFGGALQSNETENQKSPPQEVPYTIQDISEKNHPI